MTVPFRAADVHDHMGVAYAQLGEWPESERYYEQSLRIMQQAGDNLGRAAVLNNLAQVRAHQGKLTDAIATESEAIEIFDAFKDPFYAAQGRQNLAKYLLRDGQHEPGRQTLLEAAAAFSAIGRKSEADNVRRDIENLDQNRGLPWWTWVAMVIAAILMIVVIVGIALHPTIFGQH